MAQLTAFTVFSPPLWLPMPVRIQDSVILRQRRPVLLQRKRYLWRDSPGLRQRVRPGGAHVYQGQAQCHVFDRTTVDSAIYAAAIDSAADEPEQRRHMLGQVGTMWWTRIQWSYLLPEWLDLQVFQRVVLAMPLDTLCLRVKYTRLFNDEIHSFTR